MLVMVSVHQMPFNPKEVWLKRYAMGILAPVKRTLIRLHSFVLPRPEIAPLVTISTLMKGSPMAMIIR